MTDPAPRDTSHVPSSPDRPLALLWGDDAYGLDAAAEAIRTRMAEALGTVPDRWRTRGDSGSVTAIIAQLTERLATGSMFGAGTLAVVAGIGPLVKRAEDRESFIALFDRIAPGNGLVIVEESDSGRKVAPHRPVVDAITAHGGVVRRFEAPSAGGLTGWIEARAREREMTLARGAAQELARRVGAFVREGDVDRRRQGQLAAMELTKLALYRPAEPITAEDVGALVTEAIPGSVWAFTDAVGRRQVDVAVDLLERLLETTPEPVLIAVLHRRVRELFEVSARLEAGEIPGSLVKTMKLHPFRAETLISQARQWSGAELADALSGLVQVDATVKGAPGMPVGDAQQRMAFLLWLADRAAPTPMGSVNAD